MVISNQIKEGVTEVTKVVMEEEDNQMVMEDSNNHMDKVEIDLIINIKEINLAEVPQEEVMLMTELSLLVTSASMRETKTLAISFTRKD